MKRRRVLFLHSGFRRNLLGLFLIVLMLLVAFPLATYAYFSSDINNRERLMNKNNTGITLLDRNGKVFYTDGKTHADDDLKLSGISDYVEKGLIANEDKGFYHHSGYSLKNIAGAIYGNILNGDATRYGGSTITQQLVKNNVLHSDKSMVRKFQELSLAIAADRHYSKDEILEMYLNSVYFGEGAFGISQASRTYFGKTPDKLTLAESSMLIGILPAPSTYSPISGDPAKSKKQQERVLNKMTEEGYINGDEKIAAMNQKLTYSSTPTENTNTHAQHFAVMVLDELRSRYGEETITRSGFQVKTSLDLDLQIQAEEQVKKRVAELTPLGGTNAGLVAIDPKTGEIRALVGSANWDDPKSGKVNVALSPRQPGSSFKPIFFAEALDKHLITPATVLHDNPQSFNGWSPKNHDFQYMGNIPTRIALAQSRNLTAVEVMQKLGVDQAVTAAQRMGISTVNDPKRYGLTLALGTAEARLLDMTNAYAAFADGGNQFDPTSVVSIKDKFDRTIYRTKEKPKRVQSAEASYLVTSILADPEARAPIFNSLTIPNRPVAVKTGTTDENHNAWTIGYAPSLAVGVWVGNNENRPMSGVAGGAGAGPIWRGTMEYGLRNTPAEQFSQPSTIQKVTMCGSSAKDEFFATGTAPKQNCNPAVAGAKPQDRKEEQRKKEEEKKRKEEESRSQTPSNGGGRGSGPTPPPPDQNGNTDPTPTSPNPPPADAPPPPEPTPTEPPPPPDAPPPTN